VTAILGAGAATAARQKDPLFRLTLTSTISQHQVTHIVGKVDPMTGCHWHTDADIKDTITVSSAQAYQVSLADLVRGGNDIVRLNARETRGGSYWDGWEQGCPALAGQPPHTLTTAACGTKRFTISQSLVSVGYASGNNFRVQYGGILLDPFNGNCLPNGDGALTLAFPPIEWVQPATKRPWWVRVDRSKLQAGKPVTVTWKDARTFTLPGTSNPQEYDQDTASTAWSLSYTVKLVPVKS
jgi:hypothetical protein